MRPFALAAAFALALLSAAAYSALAPGTVAPNIVTRGALAGKPFSLDLRRELRRGPVVLYFFPKAFTEGCTLESRAFSEAMPAFRRAGARVIGLSADDYPTLARFSVEECRSAFPVASAGPGTIRAYDAVFDRKPELSNRTSYVIAPNGRILYAHSDLDWREHVTNTLAAVRRWRAAQPRARR